MKKVAYKCLALLAAIIMFSCNTHAQQEVLIQQYLNLELFEAEVSNVEYYKDITAKDSAAYYLAVLERDYANVDRLKTLDSLKASRDKAQAVSDSLYKITMLLHEDDNASSWDKVMASRAHSDATVDLLNADFFYNELNDLLTGYNRCIKLGPDAVLCMVYTAKVTHIDFDDKKVTIKKAYFYFKPDGKKVISWSEEAPKMQP